MKNEIKKALPKASNISIAKGSIYSEQKSVTLNHPWTTREEYIAIKNTVEQITGLKVNGILNRI